MGEGKGQEEKDPKVGGAGKGMCGGGAGKRVCVVLGGVEERG